MPITSARPTLRIQSIHYIKGGHTLDWVAKQTLTDEDLSLVVQFCAPCQGASHIVSKQTGEEEPYAYWWDIANAEVVVGRQVFRKEPVQRPGQLTIHLCDAPDTPAALQRQMLTTLARNAGLTIAASHLAARNTDAAPVTILGTPAELTRFLSRDLPEAAHLCLAERPHTQLLFRRGASYATTPPDRSLIQLRDLNVQAQEIVMN